MLNRRSLLALPLAALVAGCSGGSTTPAASNASAGPAGGMKVGLITNGSLTDSGWNSLAGKGLDQIKAELGAETAHQSAGSAQAEEALRGFARDGYTLVFAHGNEFGYAAKRVAEEYPKTTFVVSSGEVEATNVASLRFDLGEASYLAGMAAAALSKTGKAGQIGGESFAPVKQAFDLFEKGAKAVNPRFTTTTTYLGSWSDANKAKEQALGMIRAGADVIFQNADAAGEGVFQAAEEQKALVIGSNANQNDLKPEVIAASAVLDVPKTFMTVARDVQAGTFKGGVYREDLKSGNVYLALNPAFKDRIPADVLKKIEQAEQDIKSGKLQLVSTQ
jgi:basic membrane lipoprotein Med (substrate-binding protein (PBP1-ABC) superfamily)